ncbi:MAG: hypothetical protein OXQ31_11830 [Spirochaetaceae bacterium]|nr:hypothetical protein [Spirochaetaceae bacterium]
MSLNGRRLDGGHRLELPATEQHEIPGPRRQLPDHVHGGVPIAAGLHAFGRRFHGLVAARHHAHASFAGQLPRRAHGAREDAAVLLVIPRGGRERLSASLQLRPGPVAAGEQPRAVVQPEAGAAQLVQPRHHGRMNQQAPERLPVRLGPAEHARGLRRRAGDRVDGPVAGVDLLGAERTGDQQEALQVEAVPLLVRQVSGANLTRRVSGANLTRRVSGANLTRRVKRAVGHDSPYLMCVRDPAAAAAC